MKTKQAEKTTAPVYAAIDVSKDSLDLAVIQGDATIVQCKVENNKPGFKKIITVLKKLQPKQVLLEATGKYHYGITATLFAKGLPVAVANPYQTKCLIRGKNQRAKTDKIDALMLAWCASTGAIRLLTQYDEKALQLSALVRRRAQLVKLKSAEKTRKSGEVFKAIVKSCQQHIDMLQKQIDDLDKQIAETIETLPEWKEKTELLKTIPGVGAVTAAAVVSELPELGKLPHKPIAAIGGVCAFDNQSGKQDGQKHCSGGRKSLRQALFMPTQTAIRYNPAIREFYKRLIAAGKKMVAITACMHKLLRMMNAMIKSNTPYKTLDQLSPTRTSPILDNA